MRGSSLYRAGTGAGSAECLMGATGGKGWMALLALAGPRPVSRIFILGMEGERPMRSVFAAVRRWPLHKWRSQRPGGLDGSACCMYLVAC